MQWTIGFSSVYQVIGIPKPDRLISLLPDYLNYLNNDSKDRYYSGYPGKARSIKS
jgi:hypothetical protein